MSEQVAEKVDSERANVADEIKAIVSNLIEIPVAELDCEAHFIDELGVDSLLGLEILAELEQHYGIEVPEEDLAEFTSVNKIIEVAMEKLGRAGR